MTLLVLLILSASRWLKLHKSLLRHASVFSDGINVGEKLNVLHLIAEIEKSFRRRCSWVNEKMTGLFLLFWWLYARVLCKCLRFLDRMCWTCLNGFFDKVKCYRSEKSGLRNNKLITLCIFDLRRRMEQNLLSVIINSYLHLL